MVILPLRKEYAMEFYNSVLDEIVGGAILLFESIGVFVLVYNGLKGFFF